MLRSPASGGEQSHGDMVVQQVVQPAPSSGALPMLTRTNYPEWSLLMKVYLQAHGWWRAVSHDDTPYHDECNAMSVILRSLPTDVLLTVGEKENAKEAWDAITTQRLGATRVREANAQKLRCDFESIALRDGETIDDFFLRLSGIAACRARTLDDTQSGGSSQGGRLLLTWEEWQARLHSGDQGPPPGGSKNHRKGGGRVRGGGRGGGRGGRRGGDYPDKSTGDKKKCRYCGINRHRARECRKKKREEEALLAQADEEADPQMLLAEVVELVHPIKTGSPADGRRNPPQAAVFLNEEQSSVAPAAGDAAPDPVWYLDTGASNHMTGDRAAFTELDNTITGSVRFGDGSVVQIEGRDTVALAIEGGAQHALMDVYYIPRLKSSVVSLGQLDENGCDINVHHGVLSVHDRRGALIVKACLTDKQRRAPFPQTAKYRAEAPLDLVHADLCGAITPATPGGRRYFLLLVDDHSRYMWLTLLTSKDEAAATINGFQAHAETEARCKLGTLLTDRDGEFTSTALAEHFAST
ncbi:uncharacterized protein [Aegilops tauschii subsp. strangulata]|uniref:uncharacterized protein n=1 Tax=Aegilops tauschii subsp. strangulata TaxID=200361 RepID=UPI003CC83D37